ncbi:MAG TPA: transporter substrate-binding domain-containing protein [Kiritimatiellia bacterium]|nr:transporter substrate-binding domain-containing protein [Kiritimatiellia bacterium]
MRAPQASGILLHFCAAATALLAAASPASADEAIVRAGLYENRPKIYTDDGGAAAGFFPDLLKAIGEAEGWRVEFIQGTWQEGLDRLADGEIDVMPDVALTADRQEKFAFNEETALVSWGAIYSRKGAAIQAMEDLTGLRIAVLQGSVYSRGAEGLPALLSQFDINAAFVEVDTQRDVFQALVDGRADAGIVNNIFGTHLERSFPVTKTPVVFNPTQLRFAFNPASSRATRLIERLDERLRRFKGDPASPYFQALDRHLSGADQATTLPPATRAILSAAEQAWIARHPVIRLGIDPEFYPFVYREENGEFRGIGAEYIALLNERLGLNMVPSEPMSWAETMAAMRNGTVDVLPCVGITEERGRYAVFTRRIIEYQRVIMTRTDMPFLTGLEDLSTLRVGVQADSSHEGFLRDETRLSFTSFHTLQDALMALSAGTIDALVANLASSTYWVRRLNLLNLKIAAPVDSEPFTLHFAVRKDWAELVPILEKGMDLITPEERQAIMSRWVGIEYDRGIAPHVAWRIGLRIAAGVLTVLAAILIWTYRLKKEVARRRIIERQLQFRVSFERLVTETSSRFIAADPDDIDRQIQITLAEIVAFTRATVGFLCRFDEDGRVIRTHTGGVVARMEAAGIRLEAEAPDAPWLTHLRTNQLLYCRAGAGYSASPSWLPAGTFIALPRVAGGKVAGFLGLLDLDGTSEEWREEDLGLLRLAGEILADALRRKAVEHAMQKYAEDLEQANHRLQELDRLKSLFIASVSHELRTPLNSIIGFTGVLLKGMSGELNPRQQDQLARVYQSSHHLLALITDIIDISKIEAGHIDIHPQEFALAEVIDEAVESIRPQAQTRGLAVESDVPANLRVRTDRKRVRQCVLNFLSNAVKYTETGHVRVNAFDRGDRFEVQVADSGIGISPEDQQRLFSPFVRLDSHLRIRAGGTGLGLYLTRKVVVELLQGAISVRSEPGHGSVFSFHAPKELQVETPEPTAKET